ncbi:MULTISPECIES: ABC transporter substrate-binding protein [unclassified Mesorhizobium]|uniref:ABC transporter substrate-binding protein n=1 Tax=unclassified Mesorhizobium TaxID=325217 RepID=UPI0004662EC2|nr:MULTISPECIES: ABC transporter substrate-binding protein [unclassified Mesorhizobium]
MRITRSKFLQVLAVATLSVALPSLSSAQALKKYVFVTGGDFAPYDMTNPDGTFYGFEIDLLQQISKRAKFDYEIRQMAWDGMMQSLMDKKFDAIIYSVTITDERLKVVDFSLPYTSEATSLVVSKGSGIKIPETGTNVNLAQPEAQVFIDSHVLPAFKGKVIGAEAGSTQLDFAKKYFGDKGVEIRQYVGVPQAYQDLQAGRVDAVVAAETSTADFVEKNKDTAEVVGPGYSGGMMGHGLGIVVQKGNSELLNPINAALKEMYTDGSLKELTVKWFGRDLSPHL